MVILKGKNKLGIKRTAKLKVVNSGEGSGVKPSRIRVCKNINGQKICVAYKIK